MANNILKFDGVNFNKEFWKQKSVEEFIAHESHHGLSEEQLREAHAKMNPVEQKVDEPGADNNLVIGDGQGEALPPVEENGGKAISSKTLKK